MDRTTPPGPGRRRRGRPVNADPEQTRRDILLAAREVISDHGYRAATFQQIARRAGVSRPTLHYYFGTQQLIYDTLLQELNLQVQGWIAEARAATGMREQLLVFIDAMQRFSVADPSGMRFLVTARIEYHRSGHAPDTENPIIGTVGAFYDGIVGEAVRCNELAPDADPQVMADTLAVLFWAVGFHAGFVEPRGDASTVAGQLRWALVRGLPGAGGGTARTSAQA